MQTRFQMMASVYHNGISNYGLYSLWNAPAFGVKDFRRTMNVVGMTFLREGLDFRTEHEKAASLKADLGSLPAFQKYIK